MGLGTILSRAEETGVFIHQSPLLTGYFRGAHSLMLTAGLAPSWACVCVQKKPAGRSEPRCAHPAAGRLQGRLEKPDGH